MNQDGEDQDDAENEAEVDDEDAEEKKDPC